MHHYKLLLIILFLSITGLAQAASGESSDHQTAIFAGGCFWCTESDFDKVKGVVETTSGYIGGHQKNPTYKQVSAGRTDHTEAVKIIFDASQVSYAELLDVFWHSIDPTTDDQQFCDHGSQYRSEIFYQNAQQKKLAEQSKMALENNKPFSDNIVTMITQATEFYAAEDYHQDFHNKNPIRYKLYRYNCGRDKRLTQLWGEKG